MNIARTDFFFPKSVREQVVAQHRELRPLLREALEQTTHALRGRADLTRLATLVVQLRRRFLAHLAFEERALFPVLAAVDLWGPERVAELADEHARQRSQLDTLVDGMHAGWDEERVAVVLRSLASDLMLDMAEEEKGCLSPALLHEEMMIVDRVVP